MAPSTNDPLREHAKYFGSPVKGAQFDPTDAVVPRPPPSALDLVHSVGDMCDAAFQCNYDEVKRLLSLKASASLGDYDNRTPLHLAACGGSLDVCQLLVEHNATLQQDRFGC